MKKATCEGCEEKMVFTYMDDSISNSCRMMDSKDIPNYPERPDWCPRRKL